MLSKSETIDLIDKISDFSIDGDKVCNYAIDK